MNTAPTSLDTLRRALTATAPVIDVSLWLGQYPLRGIPHPSPADLYIEHLLVPPPLAAAAEAAGVRIVPTAIARAGNRPVTSRRAIERLT